MIKILEIKHQIGQPLSVRTRALGTLVPGDNPKVKPVFVAKGGVSPPPDTDDHNRYFVDLVLKRTADTKVMVRPFHSVREQWVTMTDVFQIPREIRANLEYDFKRRPDNPRMVLAGDGSGIEHLAFDTVPWDSLAEADQARAYFYEWRGQGRSLKNLADWADWEDYYLSKVAFERLKLAGNRKRLPLQVTAEGSRGILKRIFLRAYVQGRWGIQRDERLNYADIAEFLTSLGCETSANDVKNGNKGEIIENIVPKTPRTESLMKDLMLAFVGVDPEKFFIKD